MIIHIPIEKNSEGSRLDSVVSGLEPSCSRSKIASLINESKILVNGSARKPGYRVRQGDIISGDLNLPEPDDGINAENMSLNIIYQDDHIIVIDKKAGMVVHPAAGNLSGTVVNALLFLFPDITESSEKKFRAGIVHRLDKDTSGLMVAAKNQSALQFLQKEFKERRVRKKYLALISGHMDTTSGTIEEPIARHPKNRKIMSVNREKGKPAITHWNVLDQFRNAGLLEISLETGRTHQIRAHFYHIGHPLIGEKIYQTRKNRRKKTQDRQMLHSWKLEFRHPYSGKKMSFKADPPDDFKKMTAYLKKNTFS